MRTTERAVSRASGGRTDPQREQVRHEMHVGLHGLEQLGLLEHLPQVESLERVFLEHLHDGRREELADVAEPACDLGRGLPHADRGRTCRRRRAGRGPRPSPGRRRPGPRPCRRPSRRRGSAASACRRSSFDAGALMMGLSAQAQQPARPAAAPPRPRSRSRSISEVGVIALSRQPALRTGAPVRPGCGGAGPRTR